MLTTLHFFINGRFVNKECCSKKKFKLIHNSNNNIMILNLIKKAVSFGDADCNKKKDEGENDRPSTTDIELKGNIYDLIRTIKDPEKPATLEELLVVYEEGVLIKRISDRGNLPFVIIEFNPTVPHCSLATLIGLCIRIKLQRCLPQPLKVDIYIKKGAHDTEDEINKQINDKERIAAAMENPNLKELVEQCILEEE